MSLALALHGGSGWWTGEKRASITPALSLILALREVGAQVAQLVEHVTENHGVGGSIPPLGTISSTTRANMKKMASGLMSRRKALAAAGALLLLQSDGSRAMAQAEPISVYFDWQKSDLGAPAYARGKITKTSRVTIAG